MTEPLTPPELPHPDPRKPHPHQAFLEYIGHPPELSRPNPPESPRPTPPELPRPTPAQRPEPDLERLRTVINSASDRQLIELLRMVEAGTPAVAAPPPRDLDDLESAIEDCRATIEHVVDLFGVLEYDICGWDVDRRQRGALLLGFATLTDKVAELGTLLDQADSVRRAAKKPAPVHATS